MPRKCTNFEGVKLPDINQINPTRGNSNSFGNFIYKDRVTRYKYRVNNLKKRSDTSHSQEESNLKKINQNSHLNLKAKTNMD